MKKWLVTLECCHESFNGYDYNDGKREHIVEAKDRKSAIKKATNRELNPGKGKRWAQSRWIKRATAEEIT